MGILSNFPFRTGPGSNDDGAKVEYRAAEAHEIEIAIRLVLAGPGGAPPDEQVREFVRLGVAHQSPAGGVFVAARSGRVLSGMLSIVSPGRTMLLFVPTVLSRPPEIQSTRELVQAVCRRGAESGVTLAQSLLDPRDDAAVELLEGCGFGKLAELLYMQAEVKRPPREAPPGAGLRWETYSNRTHNAFARAIGASYSQSLDCPALNGLRDMRDVIAGHQATGEFDPRLWFALMRGDEPLAAWLLARVTHTDILELVYLGLLPAARGKGIGDLLMRRALAAVTAAKCARLSLAVDAGNMPALRLYWRHGLETVGRKLAMLRVLRERAASIAL